MINIKKILSILLTVITVITLIPTSVYALSWDGASSSGNNSASSGNITGYAIRTSGDNCIGYRFSCVDANGNLKADKVIDVFRNTGYGKLGYSDGYKFATKYNKKQLIAKQNSSFSTTKSSINCYKEADLGFNSTLPAPSGMGSWQKDVANINIILNKLSLISVSNLAYGDKVIVEPIYDLMLAGTYHSVTVTEYSVYGKYFLGGGSDGGNSAEHSKREYFVLFFFQFTASGSFELTGRTIMDLSFSCTSICTISQLFNAVKEMVLNAIEVFHIVIAGSSILLKY